METCTASSGNFSYMFLNLVGEVGEFGSKVAKAIRKDKVSFCHNGDVTIYEKMTADEGYNFEQELMKEAGDVLWQLSGLCAVMGWTLENVAQMNLDKLAARKQAGTIIGDGDGISGDDRRA